jgi:parvulin-like peptidyl-prolyl isomerase
VPTTVRSISALGATLVAVAGVSACGSSGVPSDSVASVNGTSITNDAFKHWLSVAAVSSAVGSASSKPSVPVPPHYTACIAHFKELNEKEIAASKTAKKAKPLTEPQLKRQCEIQYKNYVQEVLGFLISSQWVLSEAEKLGVKVSDEEVKKQFTKIKNSQFPSAAEFQKFLSTSGQTVSDLLLRVKLNLLSTKIQQKVSKKGAVTQAQVEKYYKENKARYGSPEKRNVQTILTKGEAEAKQAKKEIESGKSFAEVAKARSIDSTTKKNGGLVVGLTKGTQAPALDEAEFSAKPNVLTGPIKTPFGYTIFEVKSATPGTQQPLSQVQAAIKAQLAASGQQEALTKFVKEFKSRWKAKTECRSGYVVADCKEYKAPKTSTGAAATPEG